MLNPIKTFVKNIQKNDVIMSISMSLFFTTVILFLFNFDSNENVLLSISWFKNIMFGVILFLSFFVLVHTDYIIARYKKAIRERDLYIDELKDLIVEKEFQDRKKHS